MMGTNLQVGSFYGSIQGYIGIYKISGASWTNPDTGSAIHLTGIFSDASV